MPSLSIATKSASTAEIQCHAMTVADEETVFKIGDVVSLNSGGHLMTVVSTDEGSVTCDWSVRGDIKSKSFPAGALKIAAEPAVPLTLEELISKVVKAREERGG